MNFILNHQYSDGNTPIRPEDAEQLIPKISAMKELNEYEALNILEAQRWAFSNRTMNATNPLGRILRPHTSRQNVRPGLEVGGNLSQA